MILTGKEPTANQIESTFRLFVEHFPAYMKRHHPNARIGVERGAEHSIRVYAVTDPHVSSPVEFYAIKETARWFGYARFTDELIRLMVFARRTAEKRVVPYATTTFEKIGKVEEMFHDAEDGEKAKKRIIVPQS